MLTQLYPLPSFSVIWRIKIINFLLAPLFLIYYIDFPQLENYLHRELRTRGILRRAARFAVYWNRRHPRERDARAFPEYLDARMYCNI